VLYIVVNMSVNTDHIRSSPMNVRKTKLPSSTTDSSLTTDSKKRTSMSDKHLPPHCVPDDNEDLMILAECALHTGNSPTAFMAVPSSPSLSPSSYPPSSPMVFPSSPSPAEYYDSHPIQVEFTKDFIITLQSCIEKCLQEQLTMEEACTTIYYQFAIDPRVTEIVWRKLEEENPTYFKEYSNRLQGRVQMHPSIF
jgi:uncharacterized protein (TIGR01589 family)